MREIIVVDEDKCDGCGLCIPNCPEGALQIIDDKVRLVSDLFCDGLGACMGHCPRGALKTEMREAEEYSEKKAMVNIVPKGENTIIAHLKHLNEHGEMEFLSQAIEYLNENNISVPEYKETTEEAHSYGSCSSGCPGSQVIDMHEQSHEEEDTENGDSNISTKLTSELRQWPIQMELINPNASYFKDADLLIAADGVAFANPNFHKELLKGRAIMIACPKHNGQEMIYEKIKAVIQMNTIKSITVALMEVPCCFSLYAMTEQALSDLNKTDIPLKKVIVGLDGNIQD